MEGVEMSRRELQREMEVDRVIGGSWRELERVGWKLERIGRKLERVGRSWSRS